MVEQLLDFSRIRSGGLRLEASACDLADVTRAVVAEAGSAHGADRIHLDLQGDTRLQGDLDRLGQVAANLVGNALTHGSEARVEVDGRDPRGVLLRVSNAGRIDDARCRDCSNRSRPASTRARAWAWACTHRRSVRPRTAGALRPATKRARWCSRQCCHDAATARSWRQPERFGQRSGGLRRTGPQLPAWVPILASFPAVTGPDSPGACRAIVRHRRQWTCSIRWCSRRCMQADGLRRIQREAAPQYAACSACSTPSAGPSRTR